MHPITYKTPAELKALVKKQDKAHKAFFKKLKKMKAGELDHHFHRLHEEAFDQFNCLDCANCCSSISPIVTEKDIDRLARHFKQKPGDLIEQYLYMDDEGDYVFKQSPCPFLMSDNYCMVYENRPKACREYPHTDRRKMVQILNLTRKNCEVCPVVYELVEELKSTINK
ncbi:YkgJ family cysteine cluster protein [Roseimarinus sediminis]|uniref:YkgJ family cysteine cluster protein n=1 Tax=Roseimarinus sediminis TaxID=1610899 RepID=UPI003D23CD4B